MRVSGSWATFSIFWHRNARSRAKEAIGVRNGVVLVAKMRAGGTIVTNDCYERLLRGPNNDRDFSEDSRLCAAVWSDARCDCFVVGSSLCPVYVRFWSA